MPTRDRAPGSDRMQNPIGFQDSKRLGKRQPDMQSPPLALMPHPVDVETIRSRAIDAGEGRIELLVEIVLHA